MTRFYASYVSLFALMLRVATPLAAQPTVDRTAVIPFNLQVNPVLIPVVQDLIAASPAFAAQCARIGDARYVRGDDQSGHGVEHHQPWHRPHRDAAIRQRRPHRRRRHASAADVHGLRRALRP